MKLKNKMMVNAYSTYLSEHVDSISSYSTRSSYLGQATDYYEDPENCEKPKYLDEAEKEIGYQK